MMEGENNADKLEQNDGETFEVFFFWKRQIKIKKIIGSYWVLKIKICLTKI